MKDKNREREKRPGRPSSLFFFLLLVYLPNLSTRLSYSIVFPFLDTREHALPPVICSSFCVPGNSLARQSPGRD